MTEFAEWSDTLQKIIATGGTTLLLGGVDTGKTTFTKTLANGFATANQSCAVLDGDLGQSEIGPPACLGVGVVKAGKPVQSLSDIPPERLRFLGTTSPQGISLEFVTGMKVLADFSIRSNPERLPFIVDTGGYLHGEWAQRLFFALVELLEPTHLVALQRKDELKPFLHPLRFRDNLLIHTPAIPEVLTQKPAKYRAQRRELKFAAALADAEELTFSFDDLALTGTWLGTGEPVAPHIQKYIESALGTNNKVYYAEQRAGFLGIMCQREVSANSGAVGQISQTLKVETVALTAAPKLKSLLVGLEGSSGKLLALGSLSSLDFRRRILGVMTPFRTAGAVRTLRFGRVRLG